MCGFDPLTVVLDETVGLALLCMVLSVLNPHAVDTRDVWWGMCELGTPCDDGVLETTSDVCDGAGGCAGVDLCITTTCPQPPCLDTPTCFQGMCTNGTLLADNTTCNDGNSATVRDVCRGGVCAGVDACVASNVTCTASPCVTAGSCFQGACVGRVVSPDFTACDDGNNATLYDRCVRGQCTGIDLCDEVQCGAATQCTLAQTCFQGSCQPRVHRPNGMACDDGNATTANDACRGGVCVGDDLCSLVDCGTVSSGQCYLDTTCVAGRCLIDAIPKPNGTPCNDRDGRTDLDSCVDGTCTGIDLCVTGNVTCPTPTQCFHPVTCANGLCPSYPPKAAGTVCTDGLSTTLNDVCDGTGTCAGVDPCAGVTCPQRACHQPSTCQRASNGTCTTVRLTDGTGCDDGDSNTVDDRCELGVCVGSALTCLSVPCGPVLFSNGCGGFNVTGTRWSYQFAADCTCQTRYGATFGDFDGRANTASKCAQMICLSGAFEFIRCAYRGATVAEGARDAASGVVTVPLAFEDIICGAATPTIPSGVVTTTVVAASTQPPPGIVCVTQHNITNWGDAQRGVHLTVWRGDSVTWSWSGALPLNVRESQGLFLSGGVDYSGVFTYVFSSVVGTRTFWSDLVFPRIQGQVTVVDPAEVLTTGVGGVNVTVTPTVGLAPTFFVQVGGVVLWRWTAAPTPIIVRSAACVSDDDAAFAVVAGEFFTSGSAVSTHDLVVRFNREGVFPYDVVARDGTSARGFVRVTSDDLTTTVTTATTTTTTVTHTSTLPAATAAPVFDLLSPTQHSYPGISDGIGGEYYRLLGNTGILISGTPTITPVMSVTLTFALDRGTSGYLFALSDVHGNRRVSLYASARRNRMTVYYMAGNSTSLHAAHFDVDVSTGYETRLLLAIDGPGCTLQTITPVSPLTTHRALLRGPLNVCAAAENCTFIVGARADGAGGTAFEMTGTLFSATLYPTSIAPGVPNAPPTTTVDPAATATATTSAVFDLLDASIVVRARVGGHLCDAFPSVREEL